MPQNAKWSDTAVLVGVALIIGMLYVLGAGIYHIAHDMEVSSFEQWQHDMQKRSDEGLPIIPYNPVKLAGY